MMKHWRTIISASIALAVAVPVVQRFAPDVRWWGASDDDSSVVNKLSTSQLQRLQIGRMQVRDDGAFAPMTGLGLARLTLDPRLQREAESSLEARRVQRGAVLLMDLESGRMLVYAGRSLGKDRSDPRTTATSPAGDLFELVTSAALMQTARVTPSTRVCYRDPGRWLELSDLVPDEKKDIWCPTLAEAQARNLTPLWARVAVRRVPSKTLMAFASAWGFGRPVAFEQVVQPSVVRFPKNAKQLMTMATGAKRTSLSPVHALGLISTIATGGYLLSPLLTEQVTTPDGKVVYRAPKKRRVVRRALRASTAKMLRETLVDTTEVGKAFDFFHDETCHPQLDVGVASKVGVVERRKVHEKTTWFAGYAPIEKPSVAIVVLTIGTPSPERHAAAVALDLLKSYFQHTDKNKDSTELASSKRGSAEHSES